MEGYEYLSPSVKVAEVEGVEPSGRVFCANCIHCKLVPTPAESEGSYRLRVRFSSAWRSISSRKDESDRKGS